jgi:hypothetical protein
MGTACVYLSSCCVTKSALIFPSSLCGLTTTNHHHHHQNKGQKEPTPTPGVGDRVFYETLLRQRPDSAMAQEWCVRFGVLHHDEAERLNKIVTNRKRKGGSGMGSTPQKTASSSSSAAAASASAGAKKKKKKKAKILSEDGYDPELQASGGDAIGKSTL